MHLPCCGTAWFASRWRYAANGWSMQFETFLYSASLWVLPVLLAITLHGDRLRLAGGFAYSPNVSNTGAWSKYAAFGLGLELPRNALPKNVSASLTGGAGYSWFGNQSEALGGFPLPAYVNWNAGITFTHKSINLDLRYYDTSLSKENCFVLTTIPMPLLAGTSTR